MMRSASAFFFRILFLSLALQASAFAQANAPVKATPPEAKATEAKPAGSETADSAAQPAGTVALEKPIHEAPIILKAADFKAFANFPLHTYRVFRSDENGQAIPIPFQIDEQNEWGDYVLELGKGASYSVGNGIFENLDELSLMGNDVGPKVLPTKWSFERPAQLYQVTFSYQGPDAAAKKAPQGAIYIGIYFRNPPALSKKWYVKFDLKDAQVVTDRYRYRFNKSNYLVVRGVEVARKDKGSKDYSFSPLLDSSTFYLNVDMRFFISMEIGTDDVTSNLEAYRIGPIRTIVRVSFNYELLKFKFELGMYTEVSFFANAVFLPAIFYNPLNGPKSLNQGSGFYYGFSMIESPEKMTMDTNLSPYVPPGGKANPTTVPKLAPYYWIAARGQEQFFYLRLIPSEQMRKVKYMPSLYTEGLASGQMDKRRKPTAQPLGKSPVNLAMYFDLTKFDEGEHLMTFQLYFENKQSQELMETYKNLPYWNPRADRVSKY